MIKDSLDSFASRTQLEVGGVSYDMFSLKILERAGFGNIDFLPFSLKVLLENMLRNEDGSMVSRADIEGVANWVPTFRSDKEISFMPARVLLQDFTGVPAVADLAAMRDAISRMGGDPGKINPLQPADLVIDHSVQVDRFGDKDALRFNMEKEFERNRERYVFLRWGQKALKNFRVVPPDNGIVHQINLENLGQVVCSAGENGRRLALPDTVVGTDSHTPMINALGILGWGVGGIEAEAAMLGLPISMLIPEVVGVRFFGSLGVRVTATDLVLRITSMLRRMEVVGKFVEFYGPGLAELSLADRATIANMAPEYGATIGFFPVDNETLNYLRLTGRSSEQVDLVEAYTKKQGLFRTGQRPDPVYTTTLELDLASIEPAIAGPKRPQDLLVLSEAKSSFRHSLVDMLKGRIDGLEQEVTRWVEGDNAGDAAQGEFSGITMPVRIKSGEDEFDLKNGSIVIAAITSCANTSNPAGMIAAGILAKKAVDLGLMSKPWIKTSLAPGSKVVTEYLEASGLIGYMNKLGFYLVGYGCTTCIGNSGPLPEPIAEAVRKSDLVVASVLSGNRNFEGRINPLTRINYLASPALVIAYALVGNMDVDLCNEPLGYDKNNSPVYLRDIWPSEQEVGELVKTSITSEMFNNVYDNVFTGDERWESLEVPSGDIYNWVADSTYIKRPPFFDGMGIKPDPLTDIEASRVLVMLGDSVTTDHISPAGVIPQDGAAGKYLMSQGVEPRDFNSFGSRRGNHEVMIRGTFGNIRLRNLLTPDKEGAFTLHFPEGNLTSIYEAAMQYKAENRPMIVIAGKEYGTGSSRDWAAKGPHLLGIKAVIAESFERIHRSNLVGMGVLPLQFQHGENLETLGLTGSELYDITGIAEGLTQKKQIAVLARDSNGKEKSFTVTVRIDTPQEVTYYEHGGILQYVLRQLL